ncbi:MAG: phosphorybosylanthranilate isomerase, partial [Verrucomicrobia bacterium]
MDFQTLFPKQKPIIACIHLLPLPGAPLYDGDLSKIYEKALLEAKLFQQHGVHGLIIENFHDKPFFPDRVPPETIATLSAIARTIVSSINLPIGINV